MKDSIKKYLPSIVYGGSDGAVSYFTLMAGAYGAGLSIKMLIAIGVSNVVADAFSMATADYLSEDSKQKIDQQAGIKNALVTFISFTIIGFLPLIPSLYAYHIYPADRAISFGVFLFSTLFTMVGFSYIGYLRGFILKRNIFNTIMQSIVICSTSALVAYWLGEYIVGLIN